MVGWWDIEAINITHCLKCLKQVMALGSRHAEKARRGAGAGAAKCLVLVMLA